jgi:hypothetical protein
MKSFSPGARPDRAGVLRGRERGGLRGRTPSRLDPHPPPRARVSMRTAARFFLLVTFCGALGLHACANDPEGCFAPGKNLDRAYEAGAVGCSCDSGDDGAVCVKDSEGRSVALMCESDRWIAVEDGPCTPFPPSIR